MSEVYQRAIPEQSCHAPTLAAAAVQLAIELPALMREANGGYGAGLAYLEITRQGAGQTKAYATNLQPFNPAHEPVVNLRGRTRNVALIRQLQGTWLPEGYGDLLGLALVTPGEDGDLDCVDIFMSDQQCIQIIVDRASGQLGYIESDAPVHGQQLFRDSSDLYWEADRPENVLWWLSHHLHVVSGDLDLIGNADYGDDLDRLVE